MKFLMLLMLMFSGVAFGGEALVPYGEAVEEAEFGGNRNQIDFIFLSTKVISKEKAFRLWNSRNSRNFLGRRQIQQIVRRAHFDAVRFGVHNPRLFAFVIQEVIVSFQSNDFNRWRASIGKLFFIAPKTFEQQSIVQGILNLIVVINIGDIGGIIAQIIALIQLFA